MQGELGVGVQGWADRSGANQLVLVSQNEYVAASLIHPK